MSVAEAYQPDRSLKGKLRRRVVRLAHRRPLQRAPDLPMVSFTFDDAPQSAVDAGAALLEARGARGVFYVSAGLCGAEGPMGTYAGADAYRRLAAAGHEIACHTFSHLDCGRASGALAKADADRNNRALAEWDTGPVTSFAYPYGDVAAGPKEALAPGYATLRALHHGLITQGTDLNQTPAVGIEGPDGEAVAARWIDRALAEQAWLILYTHDVRSDPSPWGCTPQALERLIDRALSGGASIVTAADGAHRLGVSAAA